LLKYPRNKRYSRNNTARSRSSANALEGKTVGIVTLGMHRSLLSLPAVATAINGAEAELAGSGARVMLAHVPDLQEEPRGLLGSDLAGVVLAGSSQGDRIGSCESRWLAGLRRLPSVWLLARPAGCWGMAVGSNDYLTGQRAAEHLVARGHRRPAFLNPKPEHVVFQRREDGFVARAKRLGVEVQSFAEAPPGGWPLPDCPALGTDAVDALVQRMLSESPRPTAVFPAADSVAVAVYRALASRGLTVGKDVSVISANHDQSLTAGLYPHLTTFDIHAEQIGRMAVMQLSRRLSLGEELFETELLLEPTLIERESVLQRT
jgi:DNA-binding LacI/PurR family transcriptional regulator